jgi:hypothetical protein
MRRYDHHLTHAVAACYESIRGSMCCCGWLWRRHELLFLHFQNGIIKEIWRSSET